MTLDTSEQAAALMKQVGADLGLELRPDALGACGLRIDDRLDVTLRYEPNPPSLLFYSPVGWLPDAPSEGLLRHLLEQNHVWDGSRGATWSLSGEELVLSRLFALEGLQAETLCAELATFVEVALAGQQTLADATPSASADAQPPPFAALPSGVITP